MCILAGETRLEKVDARIIALHSRGVQDGIPQNDFIGSHFFYAFSYYDAIQISKVDIGAGPVLRSAYSQAQRELEQLDKPDTVQFLAAAVDILPEEAAGGSGQHGYTASQIDAFWENSKKAPLFFISMINLRYAEDLQQVLADIREEFPVEQGHLAYLTFDHCDLVLLSYGTGFHDYTKQIFKLYYGCEKVLDDVITIYGFTPDRNLMDSAESFRALIRIGVRDFPMASEFQKKVESLASGVKFNWLLGRNDISILHDSATLAWLADVRQALIDVEDGSPQTARWYTTYDLLVFSPDQSEQIEQAAGTWSQYGNQRECGWLYDRIKEDYQVFLDRYLETFQYLAEEQNLRLTPNRVWLRWLWDSCRLAVSLMGSRLSVDLATCLVPQFLDFLKYAEELFNGHLTRRDDIDEIHENFSVFFSNAAILVDSMNQTNRQFVQVPAFHLPSFDIPPLILAYYTVLAQRLRRVLQDDENTIYSLTISPRLVNILSVSSLALQDVLPEHQWLSISMDETSFYTLKLTTETLAHEISHFIGQENRNRAKRKSCVLRCAFQLIFWDILRRLYLLADEQYGQYSQTEHLVCPAFDFARLKNIADDLWNEAVRTYGSQYDKDEKNFSKDLNDILCNIPHDIRDTPQLAAGIFGKICNLMEDCPDKFEDLLHTMRMAFCTLNGVNPDNPRIQNNNHFRKIVEERLRELFNRAVINLSRDFKAFKRDLSQSEVIVCQQIGKLCYMFRETFADLQAISLLDMKWSDYCELLRRPPETNQAGELTEDSPLRILSVAKVLVENGYWEPSLKEGGELFNDIRSSVCLKIERTTSRLVARNFEPTCFYYLTEYLSACESRIKQSLTSNTNTREQVEMLRTLHCNLSDETSLFNLQKALLLFIEEYRAELLGDAVAQEV